MSIFPTNTAKEITTSYPWVLATLVAWFKEEGHVVPK